MPVSSSVVVPAAPDRTVRAEVAELRWTPGLTVVEVVEVAVAPETEPVATVAYEPDAKSGSWRPVIVHAPFVVLHVLDDTNDEPPMVALTVSAEPKPCTATERPLVE